MSINIGMNINDRGLNLIKNFEGCHLIAYRCPAGVLTIGYGSTRDVTDGLVITQAEANDRLQVDLASAEAAVTRLVRVKLTSNAFSALVSLCFNIGSGAFSGSTLLRLLNQGRLLDAAREFARWDRINGQPDDGLSRRRTQERLLFLMPDA